MNFNKSVILILFLSCLLKAQVPDYKPVNDEFWKAVQDALNDKNYPKVVDLSDEQYKGVKKDGLEAAEARLGAAIGMSKLGLDFSASQIFGDLIKKNIGTQIAAKALEGIEEVARRSPLDDEFIVNEVINDNEFENVSPTLASFVGYHQGLFNLKKGYKKWADEDLKKVQAESFWDFQLRYYTAIGEIARNRTDSAIERFSAISSNERTPEKIKSLATHQLARLVFEKGDYPRAYQMFSRLTLTPREKGLIILERAWSKYYEKDYSKALGLLAALEAPMFDTSRTPELYILRMVMYNELCYYDAAFEALRDFKRRYNSTLKVIRSRGDLAKDPNIVYIALLDKNIQPTVDLLNLVKDEQIQFKEYSWEDNFFYRDVKAGFQNKAKELEARLTWLLRKKAREVANQIVDWDDQLTFLDYQTRLDSLRLNRGTTETQTKQEEIPHMSFDRIYWINRGEFWIDELEDLKVFVEPRCSDGALK